LSDMEYLKRIRGTLDELHGKSGSDLPEILNNLDEAKAYYGVIQEPLAAYSVPGVSPEVFTAETAVKLETIVREHKIRDWTRNQGIKNLMMNEIEDYLYSLKGRYDLAMDLDLIERITQQVMAIAERRNS